jgi:hypothetical protein
LADRCVVLKQQLGELIAQHGHPPPLGEIPIIDEAAARFGDDVAHQAVYGHDARDGGRGRLDAAPHPRALRDVFGADVLDLGDLAGQQRHVFRLQPDGTAVAEAGERLRGPPAPQDDDPVAQTVKPLLGLTLEPHTERQQHHHGDGAPGDPQHGEGGAEFLRPHVGEELAPHVS